jgi:hypothetical protein
MRVKGLLTKPQRTQRRISSEKKREKEETSRPLQKTLRKKLLAVEL